jgi:hypothetical protein
MGKILRYSTPPHPGENFRTDYVEQASFQLTPEEYQERLDAVMVYLEGWGAVQQVVDYIQSTRERPRLGKAVSIPLQLGDRASEWMLEEF